MYIILHFAKEYKHISSSLEASKKVLDEEIKTKEYQTGDSNEIQMTIISCSPPS